MKHGVRLDQLVVDRGLAESREKAQRLIRAGQVRLQGVPLTKPGRPVDPEGTLTVDAPPPFVSRGGQKLQAAFDAFALDVQGAVCLDVGASTGGFTDCLLQHDAARVYAVDVGKGQLDWRLRNDPRVEVREGVNARYLEADAFDPRPRFACADVAFISLTLILPAMTRTLVPASTLVTLIKPQFEAGRDQVGKGGVVRDPAVHQAVIEKIRRFGTETLGLTWCGCVPSPLKGPAGNTEFLAHWEHA